MFEGSSFGKTTDILHRAMSANLLRQQVIANNIANSDTPGFKRSVVNFETSLKAALDSETEDVFPSKMTNPLHAPAERPTDYKSVLPRVVTEWNVTGKNNGNNVDIEEETTNSVAAQLQYDLMVTAINTEFNNINLVLRK